MMAKGEQEFHTPNREVIHHILYGVAVIDRKTAGKTTYGNTHYHEKANQLIARCDAIICETRYA